MIFCPKCGIRSEGGRFCRSCGTNLAAISNAISRPVAGHTPATARRRGATVRVFSGSTITNRNQGLDGHTTAAVFGGITIDLTATPLADGETRINVISVFGGTEIIVPDDVAIRVTGFTFCGGVEVRKQDSSGGILGVNDYCSPDYNYAARRVHISATTVFAGLEIKRPRRRG